MKPPAFALLCAVIARVLWFAPWWVSAVLIAGFGIALGAEHEMQRRRMKRYSAEAEASVRGAADSWEPCNARKEVLPGVFVQCVKRAGHDGDDADHLAGRDDLYWSGN
jgi:hypothetical protein